MPRQATDDAESFRIDGMLHVVLVRLLASGSERELIARKILAEIADGLVGGCMGRDPVTGEIRMFAEARRRALGKIGFAAGKGRVGAAGFIGGGLGGRLRMDGTGERQC